MAGKSSIARGGVIRPSRLISSLPPPLGRGGRQVFQVPASGGVVFFFPRLAAVVFAVPGGLAGRKAELRVLSVALPVQLLLGRGEGRRT